MFVAVLVVLLLASPAAAPDPPPTFSYEDPLSGEALGCTLCPPGTHVKSPCTRNVDTECAPCPRGHYTQYWNFLHCCLPCRAPCGLNQHERHECAPTRDRECECAPGHYWRAEQCARHRRCGPGFVARRNGTTHTNTACARCRKGTFSAGSLVHAQCAPHTACKDTQVKILRGTSWHDNVCVSCAQLSAEGTASLRGILPTFFTHENLRVGKLKRFARMIGTQMRPLRSPSSKQHLLQYISQWTESALDQQLWKLPEMLERIQLDDTAKKMKKMFHKIQSFDIFYCKK